MRDNSEVSWLRAFLQPLGSSPAESKASKWYAAATRQYMEETLSPRVFECLAAAETPREELISAWRQLAAAVPGGSSASCHALTIAADFRISSGSDLVAGAAPPALPAAAAAAPAPRPPPPYVHWLNPDSPIALRATALITSLTAFADEFENGISSQPSRQGALPGAFVFLVRGSAASRNSVSSPLVRRHLGGIQASAATTG